MLKFLKNNSKKSKKSGLLWQNAPDIKKRLSFYVKNLNLDHIKTSRIFVYRSYNSKSRAYARTWGFPKIWQMSLQEKPAYVIEFLSERFDKLNQSEQDKVLLHEVTHIPKNFSGSLLPHTRKGSKSFHKRLHDIINQSNKLDKKSL